MFEVELDRAHGVPPVEVLQDLWVHDAERSHLDLLARRQSSARVYVRAYAYAYAIFKSVGEEEGRDQSGACLPPRQREREREREGPRETERDLPTANSQQPMRDKQTNLWTTSSPRPGKYVPALASSPGSLERERLKGGRYSRAEYSRV